MADAMLLWQRDDGAVQLRTNRYDPAAYELHVRHVGADYIYVGLSVDEAAALANAIDNRRARARTLAVELVDDDGSGDVWLTSAEVAREFRVDPRTVARWAKQGLIPFTPTPGRHRRYRRSHVVAMLEGAQP